MARAGFREPVGVRRAAPAVSGWLHHPDTPARHIVLRADAADASRTPVGGLRHAPSAVGTGVGSGAILRVVLRNVAAIRAESQGRSEEHTSELQSQSNLVCRLL